MFIRSLSNTKLLTSQIPSLQSECAVKESPENLTTCSCSVPRPRFLRHTLHLTYLLLVYRYRYLYKNGFLRYRTPSLCAKDTLHCKTALSGSGIFTSSHAPLVFPQNAPRPPTSSSRCPISRFSSAPCQGTSDRPCYPRPTLSLVFLV